jgi:hypothetical protein
MLLMCQPGNPTFVKRLIIFMSTMNYVHVRVLT